MNNKLWCLFGVHEFETVKSGPYKITYFSGAEAHGSYYILRCKCCGKMRRKVLCG